MGVDHRLNAIGLTRDDLYADQAVRAAADGGFITGNELIARRGHLVLPGQVEPDLE
jgi:hypothetical protein